MALAKSIKAEADHNIANLSKMPGGKSKLGSGVRNLGVPAVFQGNLKIADQAAELEKLAGMLLR
jgi:hypothetical protein